MSLRSFYFLPLILSLGLSACGGGGGSDTPATTNPGTNNPTTPPANNPEPSNPTTPPTGLEVSNIQSRAGVRQVTLNWNNPEGRNLSQLLIAFLEGDTAPPNCSASNVRSLPSGNQLVIDNLRGNRRYSFRICTREGSQTPSTGITLTGITVPVTPFDMDDDDNDRLIEISSIEELNRIRDNLSGSGLHNGTTVISEGCPDEGCNGYELINNLDFAGTAFGEGGSEANGWTPIGLISTPFSAIFEGNNFAIRNLFIRADEQNAGLFATIRDARISNLKLENIKLEGLENNRSIGGLAGSVLEQRGSGDSGGIGLVNNVSVSGTIKGVSRASVGGLIGTLSAGADFTRFDPCPPLPCTSSDILRRTTHVLNSSSNVAITGDGRRNGGLIGTMISGLIISSYALGDITSRGAAGGLVGELGPSASARLPAGIVSSFAQGRINSTSSDAGGLVATHRLGSRIVSSYSANSQIRGRQAGGIIATLFTGPSTNDLRPAILHSYTRSNDVLNSSSFRHGLMGNILGRGVSIRAEHSYWDRNTTRDGISRSAPPNSILIIRSLAGVDYSSAQLRGSELVNADMPGYLPSSLFRNITTTDTPFGPWLPGANTPGDNDSLQRLYCDDNGDGLIQDSERRAIWNLGDNTQYPIIACINLANQNR